MSLGLKVVDGSLESISPLILGGATFNVQYNDDPYSLPVMELLETAFKLGINAIDTSPYYGPSEQLLGDALNTLTKDGKIHRENYYICTKVGRLQLDDFDYSPEWIEKSVLRSLKRFHTNYLDVVFLHDVEFKTENESIEAIKMLFDLKSKGLIKYIGISGYPVDYIYRLSILIKEKFSKPLDLIMSYSNMCLQNTLLLNYYKDFISKSKIKLVNNASILSMSLLRYQETRNFHPGNENLKLKCNELANILKNDYNTDLAELATRFAIREWIDKSGKTVLGVSNVSELISAWNQYNLVLDHSMDETDSKLIAFSQIFLGDHLNETWPSGIPH